MAERRVSPVVLSTLVPWIAALAMGEAKAEDPDSTPRPDLVEVAASARYEAGRVHRFALGGGYRDLWEAGIELPLLDLAAEGGGLVPTGRFGGLQTAVLGFEGADGRAYSFRGTDKDPSAVLDSILRDTIVQTIVQDQMAAQHPGGPLAAGVLTDAADVLTVRERLVVMPDDPRLGEYREEFAGMVGTFFEYPQAADEGRAGFAGATEIIDHETLYDRLRASDLDQVDVRAFLRARLMDILIGDFDRHRKQWRWARIPGRERWQPIPEDRDQAFVRYDGAFQRVMSLYIPILQNYGPDYPFIKGLTLHGWEQDRWLLPQLSWSDWEPIIADLQRQLSDEAIDRAVAALPAEYAALDGERMRHDVRGRRDRLPEGARAYYEYLAHEVDVRTSDTADRIDAFRLSDGRLRIEIREDAADGPGGEGPPDFDRIFLPDETGEVRLYLRGGDDVVVVEGSDCRIELRVIAEGGRKRIDDRAGGGTRIYDASGEAMVLPGRGTKVITKPYTPPPSEAGFVDVEGVPPRDWRSDTIPLVSGDYEPDVGLYLSALVSHTRYGFRKDPWSSKHDFEFGWAFEANDPRVRYRGRFRPENSQLLGFVELRYSGIDVLRFYGFGNESSDQGSDSRFRVRNEQYLARGGLEMPLFIEPLSFVLGPTFQLSRTEKGTPTLDNLDPYGNNDFGLVALEGILRFDTRRSLSTKHAALQLPFADNPAAAYPTSGVFVEVMGRPAPQLFDVATTYGWLRGEISGFVSVGEDARATLGLRVGAKETFGRTPYFDAAYVGGGRFFSGHATNRGFRARRFAGDTSVYGGADLRLFIARPKIIVPVDVGVFGFADVGRVFVNDESSDDWHPSGGAGLWLAPLVRTNTITVSVGHSSEETLTYLRFGFHY